MLGRQGRQPVVDDAEGFPCADGIRRERADKPEWKRLATDARKTTEALAAMTFKALSNAGDADFIEIKKAYEDVSGRCNACHRAMSREAPTIKPD